jgi:folate-dependent phosphoribosylglycinamide formyltransferase PurN
VKNIVIITSNAIRHNYFKILLSKSEGLNVLKTYVEAGEKFLLKEKSASKEKLDDKVAQHFIARHNTEYDFFSDVIEFCKDKSNSKYIKKGEINDIHIVDEIIKLSPDLIITYGCSIIKPKLINFFRDRIINTHLGLSPYYFGSGTNFHCLVNNEFQFEGYTFMYMDEGIDTGRIIHQFRATFLPFDNPHQIGNRLIKQMTRDFIDLILNFNLIKNKNLVMDFKGKTYKNKDATDELTLRLYENFDNDAVIKYLLNKTKFLQQYPLIEQSFLIKQE